MATLVTGGFGFIGQEVVSQLAQNGEKVIAFGRNITKQKNNSKNIISFKGDVSNLFDLEKVFEDYSINRVVHLAYAMDIWGNHPQKSIKINVNGFVNLMDMCVNHSVEKFVWSSSVMVYGYPEEYKEAVSEESALNPNTFYGKCKQFDEYLAKHYIDKFGLNAICLRPTTVYGAGRYARGAAAFLYDSVFAAVTDQKMELELGLSRTDLVHVNDVANAFVLALDARNIRTGTYNISGFEIDAQGLIELIEKINNRKVQITLLSNEDNRFPSKIDKSLAQQELNYKPMIELEKGLKEYIEKFDPNIELSR